MTIRNNTLRHEWKGVDGYGYGHGTVCGLSLNLADFGAIYFKTADEDGSYNGEYVDLLYRPEAEGAVVTKRKNGWMFTASMVVLIAVNIGLGVLARPVIGAIVIGLGYFG